MTNRLRWSAALAAAVAAAAAAGTAPRGAAGQGVDAEIDNDLGIAASAGGRADEAAAAFRRACLSERGHAGACLAWADLVAARPADDPDREMDLKRALGSAVMLAPEDVGALFRLALLLLEKQDWTWAIEHLEAAIASPAEKAPGDLALLRYYLGYARFKSGELEEADRQLGLAQRELPAELAQRCSFYRGQIAERLGKRDKATAMFADAEAGPDPEVARAVRARRQAATAFPRADGLRGQLSATIGINTHPTTAAFDDPGLAAAPVLQSVFRGDLTFGAGDYAHGFLAAATLYREQSWTGIGPAPSNASDDSLYVANNVAPDDVNLTDFQAQAGYVWRGLGARAEHEVRLGVDLELQYLDYGVAFAQPEQDAPPCLAGSYERSADAFALMAYAIGERLWWSFARTRDAAWSLQLKHEARPNRLEPDRSGNRFRLRLQHSRWFLSRALQLKAYAGLRYDRSYHDPLVVKYDRLLSEASAELRWRTPLPHLALLLGGKLQYHWYLNSRGNAANSFRPQFVPSPDFSAEQNAAFADDYYALARRDLEWEIAAELQFDLWASAVLAVRYVHHARSSNIDAAPRPMIEVDGCGPEYQRIPAQGYGYDQDVASLELRQSF